MTRNQYSIETETSYVKYTTLHEALIDFKTLRAQGTPVALYKVVNGICETLKKFGTFTFDK